MYRRTIFNTPVVAPFLRMVSWVFLRVMRWRAMDRAPDLPKYLIIGAPHTSNWDLPFALALAFALAVDLHWMGKDSLFRWPFGPFFRWLGGIPVDRSRRRDAVAQMVQLFREQDELVVVIAPEGTRKKVDYWKTGFYHIAHDGGVPIALGYVDYGRGAGGVGPVITPTGDIEADLADMRDFYATITAKYPEQAGTVALKPRDRRFRQDGT